MSAGGGGVQFFRFLLAGGTAALVNIVSRYLLDFAMLFEIAVVIAHLIGMGVAYVLTRLFVFRPSGHSVRQEATRFAIVNVFSLLIVWSVSVGLARIIFPGIGFTWHAHDIAHVTGVSVTAVTSYFGHKYYSFRAG